MDIEVELQIKALLRSGNKIEAIKRYREETGVGLAEAKSAIEAIEIHGTLSPQIAREEADDSVGSEITRQIVDLLAQDQKIAAIKLYREKYRVGLKEAKVAVERIGEGNGIPTSSGTGCFGVLVIGITVTALPWCF